VTITAPPRPGRHRAHEPAHDHRGRRPAAAHETTQAMRAVDRAADQLAPIALPFPETAGLLIRHPTTGALAVSCDGPTREDPGAERFPCYAVISGHQLHRDRDGRPRMWLTYREARTGGWHLVGDVHDLL